MNLIIGVVILYVLCAGGYPLYMKYVWEIDDTWSKLIKEGIFGTAAGFIFCGGIAFGLGLVVGAIHLQ